MDLMALIMDWSLIPTVHKTQQQCEYKHNWTQSLWK